jgi:hypothetical protein
MSTHRMVARSSLHASVHVLEEVPERTRALKGAQKRLRPRSRRLAHPRHLPRPTTPRRLATRAHTSMGRSTAHLASASMVVVESAMRAGLRGFVWSAKAEGARLEKRRRKQQGETSFSSLHLSKCMSAWRA